MTASDEVPAAPTVADLVGRRLRAAGVTRVFAAPDCGVGPLADLDRLEVAGPGPASILADAAGRLGRGPGVALLAGRRMRLSASPGAPAPAVTVTNPEQVPGWVAGWDRGPTPDAVVVELDLDLEAPVPPGLGSRAVGETLAGRRLSLDPALSALRPLVLAGPGVVRAGRVEDLGEFAARAGLGVVNTWGAKGVFRWDSPHHYGTAGLQARDFELAGFAQADLVVAVGIDPLEAPPDLWAAAPVIEVDPDQLDSLAYRWPEPGPVPPPPALYRELAAAVAPLYERETVPLSPARAARDLAEVVPAGGLVAADPGFAGLWVARTFPTTEPGRAVVPATVGPGFAVAAGMVAGLDGRPAVSVVDDPIDDVSAGLIEQAMAWRLPLTVAVWGAEGGLESAADHRSALVAALASPGCQVVAVPVDRELTRVLVEVAGDVIAWPELRR